jgi:catechol 2,3-dioxygenase-like lactoylglutathione lyase family enzyme
MRLGGGADMPSFTYAAPTLPASDIGRARKFYEETLGLTVEAETAAGIMYTVGSSRLFLYPSQYAGTNQATAASFEVPDIDAAVAEMRERGVTFEQYDFPGLKTDENGIAELEGERGGWFKDTEGNILALGQRTG